MKASEILVGKFYQAKHDKKIITVRVDAIKEQGSHNLTKFFAGVTHPVFYVTNMATRQRLKFRTSSRFLAAVTDHNGSRV